MGREAGELMPQEEVRESAPHRGLSRALTRRERRDIESELMQSLAQGSVQMGEPRCRLGVEAPLGEAVVVDAGVPLVGRAPSPIRGRRQSPTRGLTRTATLALNPSS